MYFRAFNFRTSQAVQKYFNHEIFAIYGISSYKKFINILHQMLSDNLKSLIIVIINTVLYKTVISKFI